MSSEFLVTSRLEELEQFFRDVRGSELSQQQYLASWLMESQGKPDSYRYLRRNGKLLDPITGNPISDFLRRDSYIGFADGVAFDKIEAYSAQDIYSPYIWISPSYGNVYPTPKIIVSEIIDGELQNWSIKLTCEDARCVKLANIIVGADKYTSPEQVRMQPFVWHIPENSSWVEELSHIFAEEPELLQAQTDQARNDKEEALLQAADILFLYQNAGYDSPKVRDEVEDMMRRGIIGTQPLSCPTMLAGQFMLSYSKELKFVRNCGQCGVTINKLIGKGYKCEQCGGIYKGC